MDFIGWVGSIMLAVCAIPQAIQSWRQGHSEGVTWSLLWLWGLGELLVLVYILPKSDLPLIVNYSVNLFSVSAIAWYKWRPRLRVTLG